MITPHYEKPLDLATVRFPVGSHVFHPRYRCCKVVEAYGATRIVRAPALNTEIFKLEKYRVHVNELRVAENKTR